MATVPTKMSDEQINYIATEAAKTYMANKTMLDSKDFCETFAAVFELARTEIGKRENAKIASYHNFSEDFGDSQEQSSGLSLR